MRLDSRGLRRVAIFRALQLGDLLCAVPAFRALRAALPEAHVSLIGLPWAREIVQRFGAYLDELIEFPGYPGLPEREPDLALLPAFFEAVRARRFDLAIQLHGNGSVTNALVGRLGARCTAGFYQPGGPRPEKGAFLPFPEGLSEVDTLLRLTSFLGMQSRGNALEFPLSPRDEEDLAAVNEARALHGQSYVCVHAGASAPSRRWSPRGFAAVADALAARDQRIVLTGVPAERDLAAQVAAGMQWPALNLAGRTTLRSLAALLSRARLLVCNDTGVSHLADALRVPSVIVATGSDPHRWRPADRDRHRVVCPRSIADGQAASQVTAEAVDLLSHPLALAS